MTAQSSLFVDVTSESHRDPRIGPGGDPRPQRLGEFRRRTGIVGRTLARGVLAGVLLGAAYRGWMRLVSSDPSFSWEGTLFIVLVVTLVTVAASVCAQVCSSVQRRWVRGPVRVLAAVLILLGLGGFPATVTMPAFALAALFTPVFDLGALPLGRDGRRCRLRRPDRCLALAVRNPGRERSTGAGRPARIGRVAQA